MPTRVLITGATGQLGLALADTCPKSVELRATSRGALDISDAAVVASSLDAFEPQVVINAAAYTAVDRAESETELAFAVNATAPGILARACAERDVRLLHVSTDFVFDGLASSPYAPDAGTGPLGVYGASKLAGEHAVQDAAGSHLILRTGWLYGHRGQNFMLTMLRLHTERERLTVVADQVGSPTRTESLATALWAAATRPTLRGIYHWSDAGVCSWYDFALAIGEEAQALGLLAAAAQVEPVATAAYPTPARRPAYSVLDKTLSWRDFELPPIHWRVQLRSALHALQAMPAVVRSPGMREKKIG